MHVGSNDNHSQAVSRHVQEFIDGLKQAIVTSIATAAEGIRLEGEVARVTQRMNAFHSVLQAIETQKEALRLAIDDVRSAAERQSLEFQIHLLDQQSIAVLHQSGVPLDVAETCVSPKPQIAAVKPRKRRALSRAS